MLTKADHEERSVLFVKNGSESQGSHLFMTLQHRYPLQELEITIHKVAYISIGVLAMVIFIGEN